MNVIQPLLDLQSVDGLIRELEMEEREIPRRKAKENARLAGVNAALEIAKNQLAAMQKRIRDEEAEAEELRAKAQTVRTGMPGIKSNKEYEQTAIQLETLDRDAEAAENRALALMKDEIPVLEKQVKEAEAKVAAESGGVSGYVDELDERLRDVKANLAEQRAERVEKANAVKAIDPAFLLYYERVSTKRWPVVVPLTGDGVCDGCHMKQPPFVAQLVQHNGMAAKEGRPQQRAACTMCGRLLYVDL